MTTNAEILLEGAYNYFTKEVNYSQENFKLVHFSNLQTYHIYSEILSRMENGEFLKVMIRYEMNQHFIPYFVRVEKSLGNRYSQETFNFDHSTQELKYIFQNAQSTQEFNRPLNSKHYLTSPSFATSVIFTLSKKFDPKGRTPVSVVGADNNWTYDGPPEDKIIFAEYKTREMQDFKINNTTLQASQLNLYEFDSSSSTVESPVEVYVSKHYGIPYQLIHGDQKIVIKTLKNNG